MSCVRHLVFDQRGGSLFTCPILLDYGPMPPTFFLVSPGIVLCECFLFFHSGLTAHHVHLLGHVHGLDSLSLSIQCPHVRTVESDA